MRLTDYKHNIYSQCGQDGVIRRALDMMNVSEGYCVEFGAWDGKWLSNTRNLLLHHSWDGCLIEQDSQRFLELQALYKNDPGVSTLNRRVEVSGFNSLDSILTEVNAPRDFDLLSIDIDSDDYHIWQSLKEFHPKLVLIETNPYFPFFMEYVQKYDLGRYPSGASVLSMYKLGVTKGYRPIAYIGHDWLFARGDLKAFDQAESFLRLYCDGAEIRGNEHIANGDIISLPTGPASTSELDVRKCVQDALFESFGKTAHHFGCLTNVSDVEDLL
jgi:hypothetical protein